MPAETPAKQEMCSAEEGAEGGAKHEVAKLVNNCRNVYKHHAYILNKCFKHVWKFWKLKCFDKNVWGMMPVDARRHENLFPQVTRIGIYLGGYLKFVAGQNILEKG